MGSPDGFQFNISVGYDLEGIKSEKIDNFLSNTMQECGRQRSIQVLQAVSVREYRQI